MADKHGKVGLAQQKLTEVVGANDARSPEALVRLIESMLANGDVPDRDIPELVSAFAIEARGTDLGDALNRTHVLSLAMIGQYSEAWLHLARLDDETGDPEGTTRDTVLSLIAEAADDPAFLIYAFQSLPRAGQTPVPLGNKIARRFLDLGFADAAAQFLVQPTAARSTEVRRQMRAEIALKRGLPNRALVELAGLEGAEHDNLRARALAMAGEHQGAARALAALSKPDAATRSMWLSEDWDIAVEEGSGRYRTASELARDLSRTDLADAALGPLSTADRLLEDSADVRRQVAELLGTLTPDQADR